MRMEHPCLPQFGTCQHLWFLFLDDTFGSSLSLTIPSTLAPFRLDAGRNALSSRNGHPSCDGGIHCPRAFGRLVADTPYLVGYCRWDSRFGRMMPPNNHTRDFTSHPFVEAICRDHATAPLEGLTKAGARLKCFGLGVDRLRSAFIVASPAIDQAPARPLCDAALEARGHDEMLICRRNIPARPIAGVQPIIVGQAQPIRHPAPLIPGQREASAHFL